MSPVCEHMFALAEIFDFELVFIKIRCSFLEFLYHLFVFQLEQGNLLFRVCNLLDFLKPFFLSEFVKIFSMFCLNFDFILKFGPSILLFPKLLIKDFKVLLLVLEGDIVANQLILVAFFVQFQFLLIAFSQFSFL